jgi:hypothetical protein
MSTVVIKSIVSNERVDLTTLARVSCSATKGPPNQGIRVSHCYNKLQGSLASHLGFPS